MKKKSFFSVIIAVVLLLCTVLSATACSDPEINTEYTVSFDVGAEASAAGVSAPESQKVKTGEKVVQPTIDALDRPFASPL